ncbi:MAG: radical SAM protein [Candidatus Hydrogenedentes bacterium]|nr:radical SAM protein [Candidatus Hydrogenedentota bacterium]
MLEDPNKLGTIARLYRVVTRAYTALPYRFSRKAWGPPTWHYYIEITRRCNLRCKMCQYIDWLESVPTRVQADGELTTEEWLNVIDQTGRFSLITFTGGEVFVRKDFMQIFEHACSKRRVHFISNATMLTDERARRCVELAPRWFGGRGFNFAGISIDGTRDVHDVIRAQKGAYDKSIRGIEALARYRKEMGKKSPLIHINTVIQDASLDCLPEMPRIAKNAGANVLNLLTETRVHDLPELGRVDPSSFSRSDFRQPVIERKRLDSALRATLAEARRLGIEVRMPRMPFEEVLNHYDQGYNLREFECRSIWSSLTIGAKGGVYPCWLQMVGNVREHSLKELRNNEVIRAFRQKRRESGFAVCRGCCEIEFKGKVPASEATQHEAPEKSESAESKKETVAAE